MNVLSQTAFLIAWAKVTGPVGKIYLSSGTKAMTSISISKSG